MTSITHIFGGPFRPEMVPESREPDPPEQQLRQAMMDAGITPPAILEFDGVLHRFANQRRDKDAWYIIYPDNIPAGAFGDWREGIERTWRADTGRELSIVEQMAHARRMAEAKAARDAAQKVKAESSARTCAQIWSDCLGAEPGHPYLQRKGIQPNGARVTGDGRLVLPIFDEDRSISSLQYIDAEGAKQFHPGASVKGGYWWLGNLDEPGDLLICEGFATAGSLHQATSRPVAIAYSASNIPSIAKLMRSRYGAQQSIVIIADKDAHGVGERYAMEAAQAVGARVVIPPEGDANDYAQAGGDLAELVRPKAPDWLVPADDFSQQPEPIRYMIKRWLPERSLIMVHGPSGGGKTFVVLDWCLRLASNLTEWAGAKVRDASVIYLAGEGHQGLKARIAAWRQEHQQSGLSMWLSRAGCDLNAPEGYSKVVDAVRGLNVTPNLIVVDTLHRHMVGDENSAQDAKTMLDACGGLMEVFGCSVLLVHHTGVSDEAQHRARGSSAWRGALDIEISVVPATDTKPMEIIQRKNKDAELAPTVYASLKTVELLGWKDEDGEQVTSAVLSQDDAPTKVNSEDKKLNDHMKTIKCAWFDAGAEAYNNVPYISRDALKDYLIKNGLKESTVKVYLKRGNDRFIGALLDANYIEESDRDGWNVIEPGHASAWMMARGTV